MSGGTADFFSLGASTISKVFSPLMPTSSSCLNFEDGGYLCHPRSSSRAGPFIRSKFPRPLIVDVTVIGSPTCTVFGFASAVMVKLPIAPEKFGGGFGGRGFTLSVAVSLLIGSSVRSPMLPNGSLKNGSENGSSKLNRSNGDRGRVVRGALGRRGKTTTALAVTGPISDFPGRAAAIAVLKVKT